MKEEEIEKGDCGFEDGPVVYPAKAFDSRQRGDYVPLGSSQTKCLKKKRLFCFKSAYFLR